MAKTMEKKKGTLKDNIQVLKYLLGIAHQIDKVYMPLIAFASLVRALVPMINIIMPKFIIDELMGERHLPTLTMFVLLTVGLNGILHLIRRVLETYIEVRNIALFQGFEYRMAYQVATMDFEKTEDPEYLDLQKRAIFPLRNRDALRESIRLAAQFFESVLIIVGLAGLILTFNPIILLLIVAVVLFNVWLFKKSQDIMFKMHDYLLPSNKVYFYYCGLISNFSFGKDIRLNDVSELIMTKIRESELDTRDYYLKIFRKLCLLEGARNTNSSLQIIVIYGYLIYSMLKRVIGLGDFSMYLGAVNQFSTALATSINVYVELRQMCKYLEAYVEFSQIQPTLAIKGDPVPEITDFVLTFEDVSFSYPRSDKLILDHVHMTLSKGEKVCLVGPNGAGKTTLIKLLCRLYKPTTGRILLNGVDIQTYDYESYMNLLSVVFQDYKLFAVPIEENIRLNHKATTQETIESALEKVGLSKKVNSLKKGAKTPLYRVFEDDGIELSGGESQKLAIARAMYKDGPIVVLDEPTSSLDPIAEAEIYETLFKMIDKKTAIFISHRLSTCTFCERIIVIDHGKIVEEGHHKKLLEASGLYAKMFNSQAEKYQEAI